MVSAAVLTGLGRLLAPYANQLTPHLNSYLSRQLEMPVNIREVSAGWDGRQPHLALRDVRMGATGQDLQLNEVRLRFDPLTWFQRGRNSLRMQIIGADLSLSRTADGQWHLMGQGLSGQPDSSTQQMQNITALLRRADVQLVNAQIHLSDQLAEYERMIMLPRVAVAQVPGSAASEGEFALEGSAGSRFQVIARVRPEGDDGHEAILRLRLQADSDLLAVQGHFKSERQPLQPWLALLPAELSQALNRPAAVQSELWFEWRRQQPLQLSGHIQLAADDVPAAGALRPLFMAADLDGRFGREDWALGLHNLAFAPNSLASTWLEAGSNAEQGWSLAAGPLPLEALQLWQRWWRPELADGLTLHGELHNLQLALDQAGRVHTARLEGEGIYLDIGSPEQIADSVSCGPLQLDLQMQQQLGTVSLASQDGLCEIPGFSRAPYALEQLQLKLQLEQQADGWLAHWLPGYWDSGDFRLRFSGHLAWLEQRPWLDMHAGIDALLATRVAAYLPYQEQPKGAREWIARAMQGGYWRDLRASLHGFPEQWSLTSEQPGLSAAVSLDEVDLAYGRNWPPARQVNARVQLHGNSLTASDAVGSLSGIPLSAVDASISNLVPQPELELQASLQGDANELLDLLASMPLGGTGGLVERDFSLTGPVQVDASLGLDLRQRSRLLYASGAAQLMGVTAETGLLTVTDIAGELGFDEVGVADSQLQARWGGHASQLRWQRTAAGPEIHLQGRYPATHVANVAWPDQPYARQLMSGDSDWLLRLLIGRDVPRALLSSNLMGTELRLPAPLEKFAASSMPLQLDWELGEAERRIAIDYADILQLRLLQQSSRQLGGVAVRLYSPADSLQSVMLASVAPVIQPGKVMIDGRTEVFDPIGWMGLLASLSDGSHSDPGSGPGPVHSDAVELTPELELETEQLLLDRRMMGNTRLRYRQRMMPTESGQPELQRTLTLAGENVAGQVSFAIDDHSWVIDTNLQRLNVPKPLITSAAENSGREILTEERPPVTDEDRIDWLTLHLICDDLTVHGIHLGQTRIEVLPRVDGMVIDTLEARSAAMTVTGSGGWRRTDNGVKSTLNLRLDANNAGDLLQAMGYERLVEGSQITLALETSWPGSMGEFSLRKMDGRLSLEAGPGVIPKASPGAGRVLGLISLQALPRRLFLDFSDVFAEGLDFDHADGILIFYAGIARTSGIVIDAAAAEITITGETDLIRGQYDQLITVRPGIGVALPILGAIAGGPIGVGAGLALQGLIGSLSGLSEIKYAVSGPWADPELRAIADGPTVELQSDAESSANPDKLPLNGSIDESQEQS